MLFSEPVVFEIPVLPRIKKFIAVKLRDADGRPQPLLVSPDSEGAGLFLWALAQSEKVMLQVGWRRKNVQGHALTDGAGRIIAPDDMTDRLGLGIRAMHKTRHQHLFNYAELVTFSNFVDYIIQNELMCFCAESPERSIMSLVTEFTDKYDFSETDMDEFALKQKIWRNRNQLSTLNYEPRLTQVRHFIPLTYDMAA